MLLFSARYPSPVQTETVERASTVLSRSSRAHVTPETPPFHATRLANLRARRGCSVPSILRCSTQFRPASPLSKRSPSVQSGVPPVL
ncbi:hypothetical protein KCP73_16935 [Salmonella enterica subsp. enterica]|nr:hypothetical protein KCP73_16935 [Salmonella enterica subsp. enterica]